MASSLVRPQRALRVVMTGQPLVDRAFSQLRDDFDGVLRSELVEAKWLWVSQDVVPSGTPRLFSLQLPLTRDVALAASVVNLIPHRLARVPLGRLIVAQSAEASVWDADLTALSPPVDPFVYLGLVCSQDVTVRLLVF